MTLTPEMIAALGRQTDTQVGHLTEGERVIPTTLIDEDLEKALAEAFENADMDMSQFTVGENASINPFTGFQEFFDADDAAAGVEGGESGGADTGSASDSASEDAAAEGVGGGTGPGGTAASGGEGGPAGVAGIADAQASVAADAAAAAQAEENAIGTGLEGPSGGFGITSSLFSLPNPLDRENPIEVTPIDIALSVLFAGSPVGPGLASLAAQGLGALAEALGIAGISESAESAVGTQEATAAEAGAGDAGTFEQAQLNRPERFASQTEPVEADNILPEFGQFVSTFLQKEVFDFKFAGMPEFEILSQENFGDLSNLDFGLDHLGDFFANDKSGTIADFDIDRARPR